MAVGDCEATVAVSEGTGVADGPPGVCVGRAVLVAVAVFSCGVALAGVPAEVTEGAGVLVCVAVLVLVGMLVLVRVGVLVLAAVLVLEGVLVAAPGVKVGVAVPPPPGV